VEDSVPVTDWPDFRNMTKQEAIDFLRKQQDPKLELLIKWIAEAEASSKSAHAIRLALADAERMVDYLCGVEPKRQEPAKPDDWTLGDWVYCAQHLRPHPSGWCTVSLADKVGLGPVISSADAAEKCRRLGLHISGDSGNP